MLPAKKETSETGSRSKTTIATSIAASAALSWRPVAACRFCRFYSLREQQEPRRSS